MERSIYEFPAIFRRVHMERPGEIEAETAFMRAIWGRHRKRPVRRIMDIACGESPHGQIFARDGLTIVGIDRSPEMLAAGRNKNTVMPKLRFYRRNFERFTLPELPFDAAFMMSETFPVMAANSAIISHLQSVGRLLKKEGLYCIDIDRHDGIKLVTRRNVWRRRQVRIGQTRVAVRELHRPISWHSALHSIYELECTIRFPDRTSVLTRDLIPVRYMTPPLMELTAAASGMFRMVAAYPDLSFTMSLDECWGRWFAVLERT
ncbi:MAG TPA: class I SAM-dependent methyltransferase [Candidatus Binataceae bacterium]|nr:class I SAM-dependent methyltransferase [Candidatus Binataceae bacterium]